VGDTLALKLDAFNLMQRVRRQIAFPATWQVTTGTFSITKIFRPLL